MRVLFRSATQLQRYRAWLLVGLTIFLVFTVRVRLLSTPLERDEGEYAYAGQLMLHGVPPYREAYNMKLPGTYVAYALIMAVFGQTPSAIHFGLALVNAASIILVFLLGRALLDETAGVVAAIVFALLSLSPTILGLAAHATHFVVLPALAGMYLLVRSAVSSQWPAAPKLLSGGGSVVSSSRSGASRPDQGLRTTDHGLLTNLLAGLLLGLSFIMKQHGLFFGLFGLLYLLWCGVSDILEARAAAKRQRRKNPKSEIRNPKEIRRPKSEIRSLEYATPTPSNPPASAEATPGRPAEISNSQANPPRGASRPDPKRRTTDYGLLTSLPLFIVGLALPYALTCLWLWLAGVFPQFWFWTVSYAAKYASAQSLVYGPGFLRSALSVVVGPNLLLWLLPWAGALVMWWDERLGPRPRFFITALLFCSFASVSVGLYFRQHYFILLLPALALLSGEAVSRSLRVLRHEKTLELFLAVPIVGLFIFGSLAVLIGNGSMLFADAPDKVVETLYQSTLNVQAAKVAEYLKAHAAKDARVAVIGSEPEIPFLARRRSATGQIYMYPMMEPQLYAAKMQEDMIAEIQRADPEYAVFVNDDLSWRRLPDSPRKLDDWWRDYWPSNYEVAATFNIEESKADATDLAPAGNAAGDAKSLLVLKRKGETAETGKEKN